MSDVEDFIILIRALDKNMICNSSRIINSDHYFINFEINWDCGNNAPIYVDLEIKTEENIKSKTWIVNFDNIPSRLYEIPESEGQTDEDAISNINKFLIEQSWFK